MIDQFPYRFILGSASPRRQALLQSLGLSFEVRVLSIPEILPPEVKRHEAACYLARQKNHAQSLSGDELLLTADTVVWLPQSQELLGKPTDLSDARAMLHKLSDTAHEVITGVCLRTHTRELCFQETTTVHFRELSTADIDHYLKDGRALDRAGAYGIQDWIGMIGVQKIVGDYYNVMGLPVGAVYAALRSFIIKPF
ncbi:MAG: Maf family nucleotide pyrophosphatase [Bernardetiaceae bacterium]